MKQRSIFRFVENTEALAAEVGSDEERVVAALKAAELQINDVFNVAEVIGPSQEDDRVMDCTVDGSPLKEGKVVPGLYCAGAAARSVQGEKFLEGIGLLEAMVFGRRAGQACATTMRGSPEAELSGPETG